MKIRLLILFLLVGALAACDAIGGGPTGDTRSDIEAAQNYLPNIAGYSATDADSLVDAISATSGGASLLSGNPVLAGAIAKIDDVIQCYQDVGAVAAHIYTPGNLEGVTSGDVSAGVVAIINQTRIRDNFVACALGQRSSSEGFSAQSAELQPCGGTGDFTINDERLTYLYAATAQNLCDTFQAHFDDVQRNQGN